MISPIIPLVSKILITKIIPTISNKKPTKEKQIEQESIQRFGRF